MNEISLTVTDLNRNKYIRLVNRIKNRLEYFRKEVMFRVKSPYFDYYVQEFSKFEAKANEWIFCVQGALNNYNYNKTEGTNRINTADRLHRYYENVYAEVSRWPKRKEHAAELFKITFPEEYKNHSPYYWFLKKLEDSQYSLNTKRLINRLYLQFIDSTSKGWAIVFGTLTVDPRHYETIFKPGSKCWSEFIQKFKRKLASNIDSQRAMENEDYFHYFAVVEEGGENGRLHIHCLLFMKKALPCRDPALGLFYKTDRKIKEYEQYWPYGFSEFIPVRFGTSDYWGKLGWHWPETPDGKPIERTEINKITHYLVKYITKAKLNKRSTSWRTRIDSTLGKTTLMGLIEKIPTEELMILATITKTPTPIKINGERLQWRIVRNLILSTLLTTPKHLNQIRQLPKNTTLNELLNCTTGNTWDSNRKNSGNLMIRILSGTDTSNEAILPYMKLKERIEQCYR